MRKVCTENTASIDHPTDVIDEPSTTSVVPHIGFSSSFIFTSSLIQWADQRDGPSIHLWAVDDSLAPYLVFL